MPDNGTLSSNSSSLSSETPQNGASRYDEDASSSPDERIRRRAYELYIERGSQPGDGLADWLRAEREYYGQP